MDTSDGVVNLSIMVEPRRVTRVHVFETRLCAIGSLIDGMLCVFLGIIVALLLVDSDFEPAEIGFSIWTGCLVILTGATGLYSTRKPYSMSWNLAHMILNCLAALLVCLCLIVYTVSVVMFARYEDNAPCHDTVGGPPRNHSIMNAGMNSTAPPAGVIPLPQCSGPPDHWKFCLVIFVFLATLMLIELVIIVTSIVLSCRGAACCNCCQKGTDVAYRQHIDGVLLPSENTKQVSLREPIRRGEWSNPTLIVPQDRTSHEKKGLSDPEP